LATILNQLEKYNIRLNVNKSRFFIEKIQYCSFHIRGWNKDPGKIETIKKMPRPKNIQETRAFIESINYNGRFIRDHSIILQPLNSLLHKNMPFMWRDKQEKVFKKAKEAFRSPQLLAHYLTKLPLILTTNASLYGVDTVYLHVSK